MGFLWLESSFASSLDSQNTDEKRRGFLVCFKSKEKLHEKRSFGLLLRCYVSGKVSNFEKSLVEDTNRQWLAVA